MKRDFSILLALIGLLFGPRAASAQTALLQGTVVDDAGGALPGATVILTTPGGGNPREATTGRGGGFSYANLPEGTVLVRVELSGFQAADVKVALVSSHANEITVKLKVGFDEEVTVSADASGGMLSPARNADSVEFDPEALRRLPTDAQDLQSIVESFTSAAATGGVSVVVDGVETDGLGIPASAIHRLIINRNPYSTEFKSPGKSRVEVETERGSRRYYHGSGALFWRSSMLQAQNAFAAAPADTNRALNEGTIGGPLPGKGWSFFASGQHLLNNDAAIINARTASGPIVQNVSTPERRSTLFGRVDLRPNKTDALTLRYDLFDDVERNHGVGGFRLAEQAYTTTERRHRFQANDHRIFSTGVLNDLRIEATESERGDGVLPRSPSVIVAGAFTAGPSQIFSSERSASVQVQDIGTVMVAAHAVRLGARMKTRWYDVADGDNFGGTYQFQSLADYVRGTPFLFVRRNGGAPEHFATVDGDTFVETSFRPASSVGITAGLRYDWQTRVADWNNLAPRVSAAFAPADRKTVFRAGVGVFYQSLPEAAVARALLFGDGLREAAVANPSFPTPPPLAAIFNGPAAFWRLAPNLQLPSTIQTSVSAERTLWRKTSITAEYLLLHTSHALRARDINAPLSVSGLRPDPTRLNVFQIESTGESRTNALTLTFRGRLAGFRGTIQYTLSQNIDDGSGVFDLPADNYNLDAERGRADFDRRHKLNLAGAYGWMKDRVRLGAVLAISTGAPFEILSGADTNHDLVANDRPAGIARNQGDGPGFAQLDLRLTTVLRTPRPPSKDPESTKREQTDNLELNLDLFNALDRVNPTTFVGVVTSPLFGRANAARTPLTAQLSLRYRF